MQRSAKETTAKSVLTIISSSELTTTQTLRFKDNVSMEVVAHIVLHSQTASLKIVSFHPSSYHLSVLLSQNLVSQTLIAKTTSMELFVPKTALLETHSAKTVLAPCFCPINILALIINSASQLTAKLILLLAQKKASVQATTKEPALLTLIAQVIVLVSIKLVLTLVI